MSSTTQSLAASRDAKKRAQDIAWENAVRLSKDNIAQTEQQASSLASEAYVGKKQQERVLPNVMAKAGLNTQGYTETTANNINSAYMNAWSDIMNQSQENIGKINSDLASNRATIDQNKAGIDADYHDSLAAYYASLSSKSPSGSNSGDGASPVNGNFWGIQVTPPKTVDDETFKMNLIKQLTDSNLGGKFAVSKWAPTTSELAAFFDSLVKSGYLSNLGSNEVWTAVIKYWERNAKYPDRTGGGQQNMNPNYNKPVSTTPTNPAWTGNTATRSR